MSKKIDLIIEHIQKYLMNESHTCSECLSVFDKYGIIECDDYIDCKRCAAHITYETCQAQKQINLIRMTKLLIKFDKL